MYVLGALINLLLIPGDGPSLIWIIGPSKIRRRLPYGAADIEMFVTEPNIILRESEFS